MIYKTFTLKATIVLAFFLVAIIACKSNKPTVVGVWKPKELIVPEKLKQNADSLMLNTMAFEKTKEVFCKFNADGTFAFTSGKDISGLNDVKGTYSIKEKTMTIKFNNTTQEIEIVKLTKTEMQAQSKNKVSVVYEKLKDSKN